MDVCGLEHPLVMVKVSFMVNVVDLSDLSPSVFIMKTHVLVMYILHLPLIRYVVSLFECILQLLVVGYC